MKLKSTLLYLLALVSVTAFSQQTPKTLLWRISGNNLKHPSYLFGTMHLSDKSLFKLGDSLYAAIERTEGFAMEINPDEMAAHMVNNLFNEEKSKSLKDVISAAAYEKYAADLSKKIGKPAKDLTVRDVVREKNKWITEYLEKGEMPTFLDAYLYNIAKRQGKWVGGVEDLADQTELLEELVDESDISMLAGDEFSAGNVKKEFEKMRRVYLAEDLDAIEEMTLGLNDRDALLINRNIKMAGRMDSLSAIRNMFFAVGAAHLPGDSGVISLLRKKGFTVEPVISSKKIDASRYTFKEVDLPWVAVDDSASFYKVMMPAAPTDVNIMGVVNMKFLMDIATTSGFCTMAISNPSPGMAEDEMIAAFSKSILQKKKPGTPKNFYRNGTRIIEYIHSAEEGKVRMQVFIQNQIVYLAMMYAPKKDVITSPEADRFFNSFTPLQPKSTRQTFSFSTANKDVTFNTPVKMNESKTLSQDDDGSGWQVSTYMGSDLKDGSYYLFIERKVHKGYYLNDFTRILEEFKSALPTQITNIITEGERNFKNGKGYFVKGHNTTNPGIITNMLYTFRDNRIYMFTAIGDLDDDAAFERFFNSIEYLPYNEKGWKERTGIHNDFTTWAPADFETDYSSDSTNRQVISFDEGSSTTLYVLTDTLSSYYWADSEEAFWNEKVKEYTTSQDSVTSVHIIQNGDAAGREILVARPGNSISRIRMLRDSNVVYYLSAYGEKQHLTSANINRFFTDFRLAKTAGNYDLTVSKAQSLISALNDSATTYAAYMALEEASFGQKDVTLLENALFNRFPLVYEYGSPTLVNMSIAEQLSKLKNKSSLDLVQKQYAAFNKDQDEMKWVALYLLAKWQTTESFNHIQQLLLQQPRPGGYNYNFFSALEEDLSLLKPVYAQLIKIIPDTSFSLPLTRLGRVLMDSGLLQKDFFIQHEKIFHQLTDVFLKRNQEKNDREEYDYQLYSLVDMLEKIATPSAIKSLDKLLSLKIIYIKKLAALALVKLKQPVAESVFAFIAADAGFRIGLYDDLKEMNRLDLFPKAFASQKAIAEGEAFIAASEEDDEPDTVEFLAEKTAAYNGKKYKFYLFKVTFKYEDGQSEYLAIAGGFDMNPKNFYVAERLSSVYWDKEFSAKEMNALFKEWEKEYLATEAEQED